MMLITAMHDEKLRTLTVPQWSKLLNVTKKQLYNRKHYGYSDQEVIQGDYFIKEKKEKISEAELSKYYQAFNFNQRLNNGLR